MDARFNLERKWWSKNTIALVTGANKGIGLQLARDLARRGLTTIVTSRDESNGKKAVELLRGEGIPGELLVYHQLDITSPDSVRELAAWIASSYGSIDILINNAALISHEPGNFDLAKTVLSTNYYGTKRMIEAMVPLLKPGSRIVNVSSKASDLISLNNEWKVKMEDIPTLTPNAIDEMIKEFLHAMEIKEIKAKGWPCWGDGVPSASPEMLADNSISKIALNAYSRIIADKLAADKQIFVNSMCPGVTNTQMSKINGHPVEIGADTAVFLALLPPGTPEEPLPHGKFFVDRKDVGFSQIPMFWHGHPNVSLQEVVAKMI